MYSDRVYSVQWLFRPVSGSRLPRQLVHHCANARSAERCARKQGGLGRGSDQPRAAECCNPTPSAPRPAACHRTHTLSAQPRAAEPKPCRASSIVHKLRECWIVTMRARPLRPASGSGPSAALPAQSTPVLAEANSYGGRRNQLIPPVLSLFTRFRPYLAHFFPVFPRFLRVFTVSSRRFQRATSRNPGPRDSGKGAQTPFQRTS